MPDVFVDTSGWASWLIESEAFHHLARRLVEDSVRKGEELTTTNFVLAELTALLTSPIRCPKPTQIELLGAILNDPAVSVVAIDSVLERDAWQLWKQRPDKNWTLVDCVSFVVMQGRSIERALTTDHHFEQAGFIRLLK